MKKYKARIDHRWGVKAEIEEVEVERESDSSVWINGSRNAKRSTYANYYDTFEQAKKELYQCQKQMVISLTSRLDKSRQTLMAIAEMSR